ncbi:unnamed protein product [Linum trigynum]|uniref:Reverse transcriptase n=1 Tax=Linum trigynum TaxID=586398 RepID=A0AAV2GQE8_9ROSI
MKAKYYPNREVLEAEAGNNASFLWKGLLSARSLVKRGCRWRIVNGCSIDIWLDKWVPGNENFKIKTPTTRLGDSTSVAELIDFEGKCWRVDVLNDHFLPEDRVNILKIPIPRDWGRDERVWGEEKSGDYSVKSAYRLWFNRDEEERGEFYSPANWDRLWKLEIPQKVKIFAWKRVVQRTTKGSEGCPFCNLKETQFHIFQECGWVRRVWRPSPLASMFERGENLTSEEWFCELQEHEPDEQIGRFLVALWFIWDQRNSQLWNKSKMEEWEIMGRASRWIEEYLEAQSPRERTQQAEQTKWAPSTAADFTMTVDAACLQDRGTGLGVVVRDRAGAFRLEAVKRSRRQWDPDLAEAMAVDFGVEIVGRYHFLNSEIQMDCQRVARILRGEQQTQLELGRVYEEIRRKATGLGPVAWSYISRKLNEPAHLVAHTDCGWEREDIWVDSPPSFLVQALQADVMMPSNS